MVSLSSAYQTSCSLRPFSCLNYPLVPNLFFIHNPWRRPQKYRKIIGSRISSFGFIEERRDRKFGGNLVSSWCCCCKKSAGDGELEAQILDFMAKSEKPTMFPTKEELMKAGRVDLVDAIRNRGGWYSLGWDEENAGNDVDEGTEFDIEEFHRRVVSCRETASSTENSDNSSPRHGNDEDFSFAMESDFGDSIGSHPVSLSSLDGSVEMGADEDSGVEGILSRLEKQRNSDYGIDLGKYGYETNITSKVDNYGGHLDTSIDVVRIDLRENNRRALDPYHNSISTAPAGKFSTTNGPESWKTWSNQRAGFRYTDFEAAEISFSKNPGQSEEEVFCDGVIVKTGEYAEAWDRHKEINHNQIRTRLQHLEAELTTALRTLRLKRVESASEELTGSSSDLHKLSDAWEFQENEFMSALEKLRSIRAKLAILEGKMALSIINAQKMAEEKQKRIDGARKALQLLRTTCIVWPNSASEVLLAGSFDGWTTQRKMEKSKTGIFSLSLKLYPGRYEIKFIVDGVWKVDPLRPIVNNNGYQNNLFLVT